MFLRKIIGFIIIFSVYLIKTADFETNKVGPQNQFNPGLKIVVEQPLNTPNTLGSPQAELTSYTPSSSPPNSNHLPGQVEEEFNLPSERIKPKELSEEEKAGIVNFLREQYINKIKKDITNNRRFILQENIKKYAHDLALNVTKVSDLETLCQNSNHELFAKKIKELLNESQLDETLKDKVCFCCIFDRENKILSNEDNKTLNSFLDQAVHEEQIVEQEITKAHALYSILMACYSKRISGRSHSMRTKNLRKMCDQNGHVIFKDVILNFFGSSQLDYLLKNKLCVCNIFPDKDLNTEIDWKFLWEKTFKHLSPDLVKNQCANQPVNDGESLFSTLKEEFDKTSRHWNNLTTEDLIIIYMLFINENFMLNLHKGDNESDFQVLNELNKIRDKYPKSDKNSFKYILDVWFKLNSNLHPYKKQDLSINLLLDQRRFHQSTQYIPTPEFRQSVKEAFANLNKEEEPKKLNTGTNDCCVIL